MLSTWVNNGVRDNPMIGKYWNVFNLDKREHFYHVGAKTENRRVVIEAIVRNF